MTDTDCIFCKIIAGEIPSFKLYEDDRTYAMMDINPFQDGHCLVLTKAHCVDQLAADPADLAAVLPAAQIVARAINAALEPEGLNLIQANGPDRSGLQQDHGGDGKKLRFVGGRPSWIWR